MRVGLTALLALAFTGAAGGGCAGTYCTSGSKSGTECGYATKERLEPGWRPDPSPLPGATGTTDAAVWPFPPPVVVATAADAGADSPR